MVLDLLVEESQFTTTNHTCAVMVKFSSLGHPMACCRSHRCQPLRDSNREVVSQEGGCGGYPPAGCENF